MPLNIIRKREYSIWLHDFIAPFYTFIRVWYSIRAESIDSPFDTEMLILRSKIQVSVFGKIRTDSISMILLKENCIKEFTFETVESKIVAKCIKS